MANEPKTTRTDASVAEFLGTVPNQVRRDDAEEVCELMREATGAEPAMWGPSIVGFGNYRLRYATGKEAEWPAVAFSPRKQSLTLYVSDDYDRQADLLARLGPHTTSKACLYIKRLSDIDTDVLRTLIKDSFDRINGSTVESGHGGA